MPDRTPEQRAADDALSEAIEAVQTAYHGQSEGVLTAYMVIAKRKWWDEDGDPYTGYYRHPKDNELDLDTQLGLIGYEEIRIRKLIADDSE